MIKLVCFELWNVLIKKEGKDIIKEITKAFKIEDKAVFRRKFLEIYNSNNWLSKQDAYKEICKYNNIPSTEDNVNKMINIANKNMQTISLLPHSKELITILKKSGLKLGIISNSSVFSINLVKENTNILNNFDYKIFSFDLNTIKPDKKMFSSLIKISNLTSEDILYIDTDRKNCKEAKSLGFNTLVYKDYNKLKKDLEKFGIFL